MTRVSRLTLAVYVFGWMLFLAAFLGMLWLYVLTPPTEYK